MDELPSAEVLASEDERERLCTLLEDACVDGRLTLEEFSERVSLALTARTRSQLEVLTEDLPSAPLAPRQSIEVSRTTAVLSSAERTGHWPLDPESKTVAVLASCKLDLRGATISSRVTTIEIRAVFSNVEIIVPEGVEVVVDVSSFAA